MKKNTFIITAVLISYLATNIILIVGINDATAARLPPPSRQTTPPPNSPSASFYNQPLPAFVNKLKSGSRGAEVKRLQEFLAKDKTIYPQGLIDGKFGPATKQAIQKFQEKYKIIQKREIGYGEVEGKTIVKLNELLASSEKPTSNSTIANLENQIKILQGQLSYLVSQLNQFPGAAALLKENLGPQAKNRVRVPLEQKKGYLSTALGFIAGGPTGTNTNSGGSSTGGAPTGGSSGNSGSGGSTGGSTGGGTLPPPPPPPPPPSLETYVYPYQLANTSCDCGVQPHRGGIFNGTVNGTKQIFRYNLLPSQPKNIQIVADASNTNQFGAKTQRKESIEWLQTLHVDVNKGDDTNLGNLTNPYKTIQKAFNSAAAGTRIIIHEGLHDSAETIRKGNSSFPILVIAANKHNEWSEEKMPVIQATNSARTNMAIKRDYYIIDGLKFDSNNSNAMLQVSLSPEGIVIQNNVFNFSGKGVNGITGTPFIIRNNTFIGPREQNGISIDTGGNTFVYNNIFEDAAARMGCMGGCIFMNNILNNTWLNTYLSDNLLVLNNFFWEDHPTTAVEAAETFLSNHRVNNLVIGGNTFVAEPGSSEGAMMMLTFSTFNSAENNLIINTDKGFRERSFTPSLPQKLMFGITYLYNYLYNVSKLYNLEAGDINQSSVKTTFLNDFPTNINSSVNPINDNYQPYSGSPIIDAGSPDAFVPVGGGLRADIGAFEFGAGDWRTIGVYNYQPKLTTADSSPTFSWEFVDHDNDYDYSQGQYQNSFIAQVDIKPTFDSENLIESGVINNSVAKWTVPVELGAGKYYFRVITSDNLEPNNFGSWSDPRLAFEIK